MGDLATEADYAPPTKQELLGRRIEAQLAIGMRHVVFAGAELDWLLTALRPFYRNPQSPQE